ncbi:MAG: DUF5670 family protein [Dehalococcoidia bacterium]|jgi:hypothetical protein
MDVLLIIGIILLALWLLGLFAFPSLGSLIYIALVIGIILIIIWLIRRVYRPHWWQR